MIDIQKIKETIRPMVINSYKENFQRQISKDEILEVFKYLIPRMENDLMELKDFSEKEFELYMNSNRNILLFSPMNIYNEISNVITQFGNDSFLKLGKYKRLREMEIASRFCIANYKLRNEILMVFPQDNPDIILAQTEDVSDKNIKGFYLEVMVIPNIVKEKFTDDISQDIANFIKNKKFLKNYSKECSLIISLDFNHISLDLYKISEYLCGIENNPYKTISLTFISGSDGIGTTVAQVFPVPYIVDYNLLEESNLVY